MIVPFLSSMVTVSFESFIKNLYIITDNPIQNLTSFIPNYVRITQYIDFNRASKIPPFSTIPKFLPTNIHIMNTFNRSKSTFSLHLTPLLHSNSSSASVLHAPPLPSPPSVSAIRQWAHSLRSPERAMEQAPLLQ